MVLDGRSSCPSAKVDKELYYPSFENKCLFTADKEKAFFQQFDEKSLTQFKYQRSAILTVRYYYPKTLIFRQLPVEEDVILDGKRYKDVNRLRKEYITQVLTKIGIDEFGRKGGILCNFCERIV